MNSLSLKIIDQISDVKADDWDQCVGPDAPFSRHAFLSALEESGSVASKTGWHPQHLLLLDEKDQKLWGCCPAYLKSHSYGEYVFDWSWADAYERAGGNYYPKLQSAIPFTPVTGQRLLLHPDAGIEHQKMLLSALITRAQNLQISSLHITFPTQQEWQLCTDMGLLGRIGHQYHWENQNYADFGGFLDQLTSRKRKTIRKERQAVLNQGIRFEQLTGQNLSQDHWDAFYAFYLDTSGRKMGHSYLNKRFFDLLGQHMADDILLVLARNAQDDIVAGALNIKGSETLYGRYWGCLEDYKFLHFETCYYQAIDFAINQKLKRVEAGAQGHHKIQRGYLPVETYSAHWIADPSFKRAVDDFVQHDQKLNEREMNELATYSPYKTTE